MLTNHPQPIQLKELIEKIKQELLSEHDSSNPLFAVGQIQLEVSFTVERNMDGGVDFKVIQTGVSKTMSEVQTIKLTLEPLLPVEEIRKTLSSDQKEKIKNNVLRGEN